MAIFPALQKLTHMMSFFSFIFLFLQDKKDIYLLKLVNTFPFSAFHLLRKEDIISLQIYLALSFSRTRTIKNYSIFLIFTNRKDQDTNKIFALFENFNLSIRIIGLSTQGVQVNDLQKTANWQSKVLYPRTQFLSSSNSERVFFWDTLYVAVFRSCPRPTLTKKTVMAMILKTTKMMMMMT